MRSEYPLDTPELRSLREQAERLAAVRNSSFDDEAETRQKLNDHGLSDDEIARQLSTLSSNSANSSAVLTSYSLLHSLQHLDAILDRTPAMSHSAEALVTLFRCAEVCVYNVGIQSVKMKANIVAGRLDLAMANARWRAGFHEVLYRLSALVVEVNDGDSDGAYLSFRSSPILRGYNERLAELQDFLKEGWSENDSDIFDRDLDDPKRYVYFSEFVNSSDERVWLSRLNRVRLPGVTREPGETDDALYARIVCSDEIEAMMTALETEADTDLLPFRAIHQVAEIMACCINARLCDALTDILSPQSALDSAVRSLVVSNRMLAVVDEAIKLMMRSLTPRAYKEVRPNLGMVRGTSSVVLRKTLFNTTYPLLVRAFKLRMSGFSQVAADDDDVVRASCAALMKSEERDARLLADVMRQLIVLHQHIRTWRDNHQQLPKTHLGISPFPEKPTVSLSGSGSAVDIAHELRKAHSSDPIIPLYEAVHGTRPPDVHDLLVPGGFEEHMAHATARAVMSVYAEVQERFYDRMGKKRVPG